MACVSLSAVEEGGSDAQPRRLPVRLLAKFPPSSLVLHYDCRSIRRACSFSTVGYSFLLATNHRHSCNYGRIHVDRSFSFKVLKDRAAASGLESEFSIVFSSVYLHSLGSLDSLCTTGCPFRQSEAAWRALRSCSVKCARSFDDPKAAHAVAKKKQNKCFLKRKCSTFEIDCD